MAQLKAMKFAALVVAVVSLGPIGALGQGRIEPLPLSPVGQPVPGYPNGAPATPPSALVLSEADIARLKAGNFTAAIAMQALDSPWNSLQVEAISKTLGDYGIRVVAVTDAGQNPGRQNEQVASLIERRIDLLFSVPIDPATQTEAYRRVARAGVKLVFMDNVVKGLAPGADYVTVVASDNERNAIYATEELIKAIGGAGEVGLITYSFESYYSVAVRKAGFEKVINANPAVKLVATERFTQPREAFAKTMNMLRANPSIKGLFAVWGDPAMQARAAAKAMNRNDIVITTNDLGPDTALHMARGEIHAIGAQLPYDLGIAEAKAGALALLGRNVPPYISLPGIGVTRQNLIPALELVTKRPAPDALKEACGGECR